MSDEFVVNGLPLPPLLISLMQEGRWRHPGPTVMQEAVPYHLVGPVDLPIGFDTVEGMRRNTAGHLELLAFYSFYDDVFRLAHGSKMPSAIELPWLDIEKTVFIAGSEVIGDDLIFALDYRTNSDDPRVVISAWHSAGCQWTEVTPTFSEFVTRLGL